MKSSRSIVSSFQYAFDAFCNMVSPSGLITLLIVMVWPLLRIVRYFFDKVVNAMFALFFSFRKKTPLPPVFNPTLLLSATQLAKDIRERKTTSVSVVRAYISRISDVNPMLNALAQEGFREALQEALRVDDRITQGYKAGTLTPEELEKSEPFLGVPFTVKESIAVSGFNQTGGLICRRFVSATRDAAVIENIRNAGAILLATTNVSELGMWWESENRLYGTTNNPYDTHRTPGGSSGGEAALMCACGTPLSLGTDIGGSVRTPAFFCGLFGHKPTPGYISLRGSSLVHTPDNVTVLTVGPITRHAEDLLPLLKVLCSEDQLAKYALDTPVNLAHVKVYSMADDCNGVTTSPVCKDLRDVQEAVCQYFLTTHDISVTKMRLPALQKSFKIWHGKLCDEYRGRISFIRQLADNKGEINLPVEFVRAALGRANHTWSSLIQAFGDKYVMKEAKGKEQLEVGEVDPNLQWRSILGKLQRTLGTDGVLLYPSSSTLAPYHRQPFLMPLNFTYTAIFNALGLPVTQVPLGLSPSGLPMGIQVVGGLHMDRLTVAVAADLEKGFGGWKCPAQIL